MGNTLIGSLSHYLQGFGTIPGGCLGFLIHQLSLNCFKKNPPEFLETPIYPQKKNSRFFLHFRHHNTIFRIFSSDFNILHLVIQSDLFGMVK